MWREQRKMILSLSITELKIDFPAHIMLSASKMITPIMLTTCHLDGSNLFFNHKNFKHLFTVVKQGASKHQRLVHCK